MSDAWLQAAALVFDPYNVVVMLFASLFGLFVGSRRRRSQYDAWMSRLHHFLKENDTFQARAPRRLSSFPPGSLWLLFSDGVAHAQLRGRLALEHSYFVTRECLSVPSSSPLSVLLQNAESNRPRRAGPTHAIRRYPLASALGWR